MQSKASPFVVVIATLVVMLAGCGDAIVSPREVPPADGPTTTHGQPDFPPISAGAAVYNRTTPSYIPGSSRYVLYDDSTFALQYWRPDWGFFEYPGEYRREDSAMSFYFDGYNTAGAWVATGTLDGQTLTVAYNLVMMMSDFEDGVYVGVSSHSTTSGR
jgi:predicted small lipoprotein YifL